MRVEKLSAHHAASFAMNGLSSLFTVCALALDASKEWSEKAREEHERKIFDVLMLGAALADEATLHVEKLEVRQ